MSTHRFLTGVDIWVSRVKLPLGLCVPSKGVINHIPLDRGAPLSGLLRGGWGEERGADIYVWSSDYVSSISLFKPPCNPHMVAITYV